MLLPEIELSDLSLGNISRLQSPQSPISNAAKALISGGAHKERKKDAFSFLSLHLSIENKHKTKEDIYGMDPPKKTLPTGKEGKSVVKKAKCRKRGGQEGS